MIHDNTNILEICCFIDGPHQVIISPSTQTYTVTETTGRVGPITCSADCKPKCTTRWSGPNLSVSTTSVLYLENINRNQTGNYQCSCANIVGSLASVTISVFVYCEYYNIFIDQQYNIHAMIIQMTICFTKATTTLFHQNKITNIISLFSSKC